MTTKELKHICDSCSLQGKCGMGKGLINQDKNRLLKNNGFDYKFIVLHCPIYEKRRP